MNTPYLSTLFTTLAQVSFTLTGLMAVAIAGDGKRRDYWLGNESRSLFVYLNFLLLLLPGFVSLGGLIPPISSTIPFWFPATGFFGVVYFFLAITFFFRRRKLDDPKEFERLEKRFSGVNSEIGTFGFALFAISFGAFNESYIPFITGLLNLGTFLGIILVLAMFGGAINSIIFFRINETPSKADQDAVTFPVPKQESTTDYKSSNSGIYLLAALVITTISFLVGILVQSRDD